MKPPAPVTLQGRLVRLEPLTREHLPALSAVGLDPDLWRWTVSRVRDEREMAAWLDTALAEQAAGRSVPFTVLDRAAGLALLIVWKHRSNLARILGGRESRL